MTLGLAEDGMIVSYGVSVNKGNSPVLLKMTSLYSIPNSYSEIYVTVNPYAWRRIIECPVQSEALKEGQYAGEALAYQKSIITVLV
jgi:hypothetical protein